MKTNFCGFSNGVPLDEKSKRKDALIRIIKFKLDEYLRSQNPHYMNFNTSSLVPLWDPSTSLLFTNSYDLYLISEKVLKKKKIPQVLFDPFNKEQLQLILQQLKQVL
jgi:hypothetical protein